MYGVGKNGVLGSDRISKASQEVGRRRTVRKRKREGVERLISVVSKTSERELERSNWWQEFQKTDRKKRQKRLIAWIDEGKRGKEPMFPSGAKKGASEKGTKGPGEMPLNILPGLAGGAGGRGTVG